MLSFLQRDRHTDRDYTCLCLRGREKRELVCACVRVSHRHITLYCKHIILDYQNTTKTNKQTKSKSTGPFYNHCHSLKIDALEQQQVISKKSHFSNFWYLVNNGSYIQHHISQSLIFSRFKRYCQKTFCIKLTWLFIWSKNHTLWHTVFLL